MPQPPEDKPLRQHVDEVAWMREVKHQREFDARLDWQEYYLQHPDYPGHANDNGRDWGLPVREPNAEIDEVLDGLLKPRPEHEPTPIELALQRHKSEARIKNRMTDFEQTKADRSLDSDRW